MASSKSTAHQAEKGTAHQADNRRLSVAINFSRTEIPQTLSSVYIQGVNPITNSRKEPYTIKVGFDAEHIEVLISDSDSVTTAERPHRMSSIIEMPSDSTPMQQEMLKAVAATGSAPALPPTKAQQTGTHISTEGNTHIVNDCVLGLHVFRGSGMLSSCHKDLGVSLVRP